ncbi:hypothetical protein NDU88_000436 [Pleurodeles waltl]|uniref:Uncharacterized protein n=1 Tax=Pleurodeles waltl TaxID=8319 RepID=A0AAV7WJQ2_PLEWA|nr:hypothetical protein NDU88_000436 [Pleurodeles waltl]
MIIPPVHISVKEGAVLPRLPQYTISQEGEEALTQIVYDLIAVGVVEEVLYNVCNSPILPILKKDTDTRIYRFIIDLREVNKIVIPQYPVVSDITTLLTLVPPTATMVVILTSAVKGAYRRSEILDNSAAVIRHGHSDTQQPNRRKSDSHNRPPDQRSAEKWR